MNEFIISELLRTDGYIPVNKALVRELGLSNAVFLCDLITKKAYFRDNGRLEEGWFFNTESNRERDTGLTPKRQRTCVMKLEKLGILKQKRKGIPARQWFFIYEDRIAEIIENHAKKKIEKIPQKRRTSQAKKGEQDRQKSNNMTGQKDELYNKNNIIRINNKRECESEKNLSYKKPFHMKKEKNISENLIPDIKKLEDTMFFRLAGKIIDILSPYNNIAYTMPEIHEFLSSIRTLVLDKKVSEDRIDTALNWYSNHVKERFTPAIHNGQDFYNKFTNIEDAMVRHNLRLDKKKNKTSPKNRKPIIPKS